MAWVIRDDNPIIIRPESSMAIGTSGAGSSIALWVKGKEVSNSYGQSFFHWPDLAGAYKIYMNQYSAAASHYRKLRGSAWSEVLGQDVAYTPVTRVFEDWTLFAMSWSGTRMTLRTSGGVAVAYDDPLAVASLTLDGDIEIGAGISGWTSHADVDFAELSVFDFALDDTAFDELAKGMDPLRLGGGPVLYFSGDPKRDRGCTLINNGGVQVDGPPQVLGRQRLC